MKKRGIVMGILCAAMVSCSACGDKNAIGGIESAESKKIFECQIKEHELPDADSGLIKNSDDWVKELDIKMVGNKVYRLAQLWGQDTEANDEMDLGYYIQISEYPFDEWKNYEAPYLNLDGEYESVDIRHGYKPCRIAGIYDEVVYFVSSGYLENDKNYFAFGKMDTDGAFSLISKYPITEKEPENQWSDNQFFFDGKDTVYSYKNYPAENKIISYNLSTKEIRQDNYSGKIEGIDLSEDASAIWYGNNEETFFAGTVDEKESAFSYKADGDISAIQAMAKTADGWYVTDTESLMLLKEDGSEDKLIDWKNRGYFLSNISKIEKQDNTLKVLTDFEGSHYVLEADLDSKREAEKQEVVISMPFKIASLDYYIAMFNRTNADYHINVSLPEDPEDMEKYQTDLKKAFLTGTGPDLIVNGIMEQKDMVQNGLINSVGDLIQDKSKYFDAVLQNGLFEGEQYGIPYEFYMETAAYPKRILGDRAPLSLKEMMEITKEADAEAVALNTSGEDIVFYYGLLDETNPSFIDWNNRKSHLDSPEFVELIKFASKYACPENINENNYKEKIDAGKIISENLRVGSPEVMNYLDACFDGNVSLAGYPRNEGSGAYAFCNMLYLNAKATCPEGAKEFLKFIISHDAQMKNAQSKYSKTNEQKYGGHFPVEKEAFYRELELAQANEVSEGTSSYMNGISYKTEGLSEENANKLKKMAEEASPINYELFYIWDIISEELAPFFAGERTAEEAANVMNSRVQIYLDEK